MNKYLWAECTVDNWPEIKSLLAKSYNDAVEKLANKYSVEFDDDKVLDLNDDFLALREYLNEKYDIALSDLEIDEEL
jgi:hypothetical protein